MDRLEFYRRHGYCPYVFLANHGMAWIDLAVTSVVIKNFPSNRGLTMGLVQTQVEYPLCVCLCLTEASSENMMVYLV